MLMGEMMEVSPALSCPAQCPVVVFSECQQKDAVVSTPWLQLSFRRMANAFDDAQSLL